MTMTLRHVIAIYNIEISWPDYNLRVNRPTLLLRAEKQYLHHNINVFKCLILSLIKYIIVDVSYTSKQIYLYLQQVVEHNAYFADAYFIL